MTAHQVQFHASSDVATSLRMGYALRCRRCGSNVAAWLDMRHFRNVLGTKSLEERMHVKLELEWTHQVPHDCDEAMAINTVRMVQES